QVFTRLCSEQMESKMKMGKFHSIPIQDRRCICRSPTVEDLTHYTLNCQLYADRECHLDLLLKRKKL
ncbi:hypothetical protein JRQ81_010610, partial [Phrynocephalus forsythii]